MSDVQLHRTRLPYGACYVLAVEDAPGPEQVDRLWSLAHRIARELARQHFGDPDCFSIVFSGARARRRPWAHFHLVVARTAREKHLIFLLLALRRLFTRR